MTAPVVTIRPARVSDAEAIAWLTKQLGYEVAAPAVAGRLSRILSRPDQQFVVADHESRSIGWIHMQVWEFVEAEAFVVIGGLVVDRDYRKQGIGRKLLAHAEQWATQQRCSIVRLWSSSTRTEAHAFYERAGYLNIKTQYSFLKALDGAAAESSRAFVPDLRQ
jgi:GNAT superfamily N-acetyltransferase